MSERPNPSECSRCGEWKPLTEFSPNQYRKNNIVVRRAYCKECGKKIKQITTKERKTYERTNPRPKLLVPFTCPICERTRTPWHKNQVCLDHNHDTGEIRGYLCGDCNASIGRLSGVGDDETIFQRAILWIKGKLNTLFAL